VTKRDDGPATVERSERIRLFCGLQLGDATVACLAAWQAANLERGRIVAPENLHITLAFLGHRPVEEVEPVAEALRDASAAAGPIELRARRYRETRSVGMVELEDVAGTATALAGDVQQRLEALGVYRREGRPWLPHVTVLRFRTRAGLTPAPPNTCSIHVVRSALYRSSLGAGGARYEAIATGALGGR
jgi:2'-5' RNA ligase